MTTKHLEIHSENILPIIKKWLYSDRDIFVRELVSNACDAIYKVKLLRDQQNIDAKDDEFRVDIAIDKEKKTITFTDNGIGMDADEIVKYIAQIAFSGAEDFVNLYQTSQEKDQFIGHFGLGFYSAYMVAEKVEIKTLSYKPGAKSALWSCDGSSEYTLEEGAKEKRGTEITLYISKENEEFLDTSHLKSLLTRYCGFLPYPIFLNEEQINSKDPLWIKAPSECQEKDYLEFYRHLYPLEEEPLFWMHLNVDYPFHLKGILYFPKMKRDIDTNKSSVKLFCNRVFVSDDCKDVIPNYLTILRGVIDSPDIPLNVSRSTLQMDKTVRQLAGHISKKVSDSLSSLYKTDKERFIRAWNDVSIIVKLGILEDEKFYEKVKNTLIWKTSEDQWLTVEEYLDAYREKTGDKILYTRDESHQAHVISALKEKGVAVLIANHPIDTYLMPFIERKIPTVSFQRIDGGVHDLLIDKQREKSVLDAEGKTEASKIADFIRSKLENDQCEVEAKSLATDELAGFVMIEEQQRRMRDYMLSMDPQGALPQMGKHTFVVNTNHPLVSAAKKLESIDPDLTKELVKQLYEMALLSQREIEPTQLNTFIARTQTILKKLTEKAVG